MPTISSSSTLHITYSDDKNDCYVDHALKSHLLPPSQTKLHWLEVIDAKLLTRSQDVNTVIELSLENLMSLDYKAGDTIGIIPENDITEVDIILQRLKVFEYSDLIYTIHLDDEASKSMIPSHIPHSGTLKYVFQHLIDIRRVPSKTLINLLCTYTYDFNEKISLKKICEEKGAYAASILERNTKIIDLLEQFPSCQPPVTVLMQHLPRIMPRPYSLCNSFLKDKNTMKICFSVVKHTNNMKGLTTGWLERIITSEYFENNDEIDSKISKLKIGDEYETNFKLLDKRKINIPLFLKKSTFNLPSDQSAPIIMICNGTGIAPFIGFLEEIQSIKKSNPNVQFGNIWLYYGCRYADKDFLYKEQLMKFLDDGTLSKLKVSYSRQNDEHKYVQHILASDMKEILNLLEVSPTIYVCGSNKMAKQVESLFIESIKISKEITELEAKNSIKEMKKQKKYIQDIWV